MKRAALGFRVHSGWAALVALALEGDTPRVLLKQRPHLVEHFTYEFRQPYHTAARRSAAEGEAFIRKLRLEAKRLTLEVLGAACGELRKQGFAVEHCGLLTASAKALPDLPHILGSHALIHTADGELFREAVVAAAGVSGMEVFPLRESEVLAKAARATGLAPDELSRRLVALGRPLGSPWAEDEKLASLAAWLCLLHTHTEASFA